MSYITKNHKQTIVYWASPTPGKFGTFAYTAPVEITGRWEDRQVLFLDKEGKEITSKSIVYLGQDVDLGGFLYLGTLASIASAIDETHPKNVDGAEEIRGFTKIPNLRATDFERRAFITGRDTGTR